MSRGDIQLAEGFVVRKPKVKVLAVPVAYHFPARQIQKMLERRD
jgi:hypothetical protein